MIACVGCPHGGWTTQPSLIPTLLYHPLVGVCRQLGKLFIGPSMRCYDSTVAPYRLSCFSRIVFPTGFL